MDTTTYSVGELTLVAARAVARSFPDQVWVEGEIRDLSRSASGHVYFSLVDGEAAGRAPDALLPVTLFASDREAVNRALVQAGSPPRMEDGIRVRIRGAVALYRPRGTVQLRMTAIDTEFTVGFYAAERARLLASLAEAGLIDSNRAIPFPLVPLRVGLVTSRGSAAEADFLSELGASGFAFSVLAVDTRVQGQEAAHSIAAAIRVVASTADVVAVIRGGGSQLDLLAFDSEAAARAIATAPVPVVTGIGHEIDESVADRVAWAAFRTPTACAAALVDRVARFNASITTLGGRVAGASALAMTAADARLDAAARRVVAATAAGLARGEARLSGALRALVREPRRLVDALGRDLGRVESQIRAGTGRTLREADDLLAARASVVAALDPKLAMARGWSIVRTVDGRIVRSPHGLAHGDRLVTTTHGGDITSEVTALRPEPDTGTMAAHDQMES